MSRQAASAASLPLQLWSRPIPNDDAFDSDTDSDVDGIALHALPLPQAPGTEPRRCGHADMSTGAASCPPDIALSRNPTQLHANDIISMELAQTPFDSLLRERKCDKLPSKATHLLQLLHSSLVHTVARAELQAQKLRAFEIQMQGGK